MKRQFLIAIIAFLTAAIGHAATDVVVDGVTYEWSANDGGYIVTGWDEETPIQSLHIHGEVNGLNVVGIALGAFEDNEDIVYLTIDEGITSIGENAFCRCYNLQVAILPEGLETIEEEAFAFCTGLTMMVIPSTVTDIQAHAFSGCTGVTDVYFLMTDEDQLDNFDWWDGVYPSQGEEEHGGMEFNTNAFTTIHVPEGTYDIYDNSGKLEAWLFREDDNCYPLWWIVNYGVVGHEYTICDDLTAVYVDKNEGLYAKDDNEWLTPDRAYSDEIDYMISVGLLANRGNVYDQSNWVELKGIESPDELVGYIINGASVKGTLLDKTNPVIEVSDNSTPQRGRKESYIPNTYIAASLMSRTQVGVNEKTYAFVRPKPQEVANYEWTIYGGDNDFYVPEPDDDNNINKYHFKGGFSISDELYDGDMPDLQEEGYYPFLAITRSATTDYEKLASRPQKVESSEWAPYIESGVSPWFIVYPLWLPEDPVVTAIDSIEADKLNESGLYYDLQGHVFSSCPESGLYIHNGKLMIVKHQKKQ